ncbi:hypothetical protein L873DRAFT_644280 [Choiromyces venosus 120613-1]|uniref:Uncharacterized protein n=1 Tax=Choiromyces venosus 120613-1 TaxID=1336337 RepID=A0A3N4JTH7_9PEZI|nr:hypothetical protein L873DRAFT_644280 [Choiromyces venosus 120613-1]
MRFVWPQANKYPRDRGNCLLIQDQLFSISTLFTAEVLTYTYYQEANLQLSSSLVFALGTSVIFANNPLMIYLRYWSSQLGRQLISLWDL